MRLQDWHFQYNVCDFKIGISSIHFVDCPKRVTGVDFMLLELLMTGVVARSKTAGQFGRVAGGSLCLSFSSKAASCWSTFLYGTSYMTSERQVHKISTWTFHRTRRMTHLKTISEKSLSRYRTAMVDNWNDEVDQDLFLVRKSLQ
jgi:hypothetical protein